MRYRIRNVHQVHVDACEVTLMGRERKKTVNTGVLECIP